MIDSTGYGSYYDYKTFYTGVLGRPLIEKKYPYYITHCPFHKDHKNPNLRINVISGNYRCYACGARGGAFMFITSSKPDSSLVVNLPKAIYSEEELQLIQQYETDRTERKETDALTLALEDKRATHTHELLLRQPIALKNMMTSRGLTMQSVKQWKLGYFRGTYTIPILDINGNISSLKFHKKFQTEFARNQLMPWSAVTEPHKDIILVEGEWDMMLLQQLGFNAVTQTNGANSWDTTFSPYFRRKKVTIAYDNDAPGRAGALIIGKILQEEHSDVCFLQWPSWMQNKEDHVDFFVKHRRTAKEYQQLLSQAVSIINL